ncbi:SDR family oxidoreductase [Proteobacteria bacterium 005FR1]|nr:SDR family oxidoreductase [Proteobacteria bacterium 005FR1]
MKKVAFITGASRGIGRAAALAFARAGYDLALSARTLEEGEIFQHAVRQPDGKPLPGSLENTAELVRQYGVDAQVIRMDLLDRESVVSAGRQVLEHFGRVDVLINNAVYQGPDLNLPFMSLEAETLERVAQGYIVAPFLLTRTLMPAMLEQGGATVINVTSGAGETDPPIAADQGGWGYAYGAGKAAVSRLSGVISRELGGQGIRAFTVNPGVVATDTLKATIGEKGIAALGGGAAPPELPAAVFLWLAEHAEANEFQFQTIRAQSFATKQGITAS